MDIENHVFGVDTATIVIGDPIYIYKYFKDKTFDEICVEFPSRESKSIPYDKTHFAYISTGGDGAYTLDVIYSENSEFQYAIIK